jgi:hypothetical protein
VIDLVGGKAPLTADFLPRQMATIGQFAHLAHIAMQVNRQLRQIHEFILHDAAPAKNLLFHQQSVRIVILVNVAILVPIGAFGSPISAGSCVIFYDWVTFIV